jgi:hypothetical protein
VEVVAGLLLLRDLKTALLDLPLTLTLRLWERLSKAPHTFPLEVVETETSCLAELMVQGGQGRASVGTAQAIRQVFGLGAERGVGQTTPLGTLGLWLLGIQYE